MVSLQPRLKAIFCVFEEYLTYMKPRSMESLDSKMKTKFFEYFRKYIQIFCPSGEERREEKYSKPKLSQGQEVVDQRRYLESKRADTFAGILQILSVDKNGIEMERILEKLQFIYCNEASQSSTSDMVNFVLGNIVLHSIKPTSKLLKKHEELVSLVKKALQIEGTNSNHTELYYLHMLLMWPTRGRTPFDLTTYQNISTYVTSAKRSYQRRFSHIGQARRAVAHFFLGKCTGLTQIVSKRMLEQIARLKHSTLIDKTCKAHYLWQSGVVWKDPDVKKMLLRVKGKSESHSIYVYYPGNVKIPVRPVYLGDIRSGGSQEIVSFYLGFSMEGPVAYDIQYENDP